MADLNTKTFTQIVQAQAAAIQARSAGLIDFAVGSIVRAISEAVAGVVLWLQALILAVQAMTRLSTSSGADVDSFVFDFGGPFVDGGVATFARLPAAAAHGIVTFSRFTSTGSASVPVGAQVQTTDGSQRFVVVPDILNVNYDQGQAAYLLGPGISDITVPVVAITEGSAGNVLAGTVTVIGSAIPGVDTVTNAQPFVGGRDAESDEAVKVRFREYILSLREATSAAILYHAMAVQSGLRIVLVENRTLAGDTKRGFVFLVVDDGTGAPPSSLLTAVSAAVNAHRAAGIEYAIYAPSVVTVGVTASVALISGLSPAETSKALADVDNAITAFIAAQPVGADLVYNQLYQIAYNASPFVQKVTSLLVNGATADITTTLNQVVKPGVVTVT